MFQSIFDARKVSVWYPDELEHFRIEGKPLRVPCVIVLKAVVFPVLTEVQDCGKLLF